MNTNDFTEKVSWKYALHIRFKKLLLDLTSAKVWVLAFVLYSTYTGISFDVWFYIFAATVLGLKDMQKMILAFRGGK